MTHRILASDMLEMCIEGRLDICSSSFDGMVAVEGLAEA
jgi:hypothetical protein